MPLSRRHFQSGVPSGTPWWHASTPSPMCRPIAGTWRVFGPARRRARQDVHRERRVSDQPLDEMDAGFFGISPGGRSTDPQQRLLLEVAWEAMENAGLDVHALAGSRTGVFIGGFTLDHMLSQMGADSREQIGQHTAVGSTMTMLSNRLSHAFDFRGPSISMDTACSSSLVALHQAAGAVDRSMHRRVGGWRQRHAAARNADRDVQRRVPGARQPLQEFDSRADGYARGEGAGIVVLKRLSDAIRDEIPFWRSFTQPGSIRTGAPTASPCPTASPRKR